MGDLLILLALFAVGTLILAMAVGLAWYGGATVWCAAGAAARLITGRWS